MRWLLIRLTRNSLKRQEKWRGGQGNAPLGLPPPLGERGGHPHSLSKILKKRAATGFHQNKKNIPYSPVLPEIKPDCTRIIIKTQGKNPLF